MTDRRKDILREIARRLRVTLSPETLDVLADRMVQIKLAHRKMIVREGEICNYFFYIEKGFTRQFYIKNGKEITEHLACEGDLVCCLESFFTRKPSTLQMQTLEPTILFGFPYDEMEALTKESYEVCRLYFAILQTTLLLQQRKADMLRFEDAEARYRHTLEKTPQIAQRSPLQYLASILQMRPETLSRVRRTIHLHKD